MILYYEGELHLQEETMAKILVTATIVDGRVSAVAGDILDVEGRDRAFILSNNLGVLLDEPKVSGLIPYEEKTVVTPKPEAPKMVTDAEVKDLLGIDPIDETVVEPRDEGSTNKPETSTKPELEQPKPYASKPEWVAYAIAWGADEDKANSMSKADLVKLYGNSAE
jgi:hypothetical protein